MLKPIFAVTLALLVTGCVTGRGTDTGCAAFRPIYLTVAEIDALTDDSVAQVLAHNETGAKLCGWRTN